MSDSASHSRGSHACVRDGGGHAEGRFRLVTDVFRHETTRQWQDEVVGELQLDGLSS